MNKIKNKGHEMKQNMFPIFTLVPPKLIQK